MHTRKYNAHGRTIKSSGHICIQSIPDHPYSLPVELSFWLCWMSLLCVFQAMHSHGFGNSSLPTSQLQTDPPQDTAEPDSQAGGASGKVHFKRAKCCATAVRHRSEEKTKCEKQPCKN